MIESEKAVCQRIKRLALESEKDIELLYSMPCIFTRNSQLYELRTKILKLKQLCDELIQVQPRQRNFTLEELSKYTGKDGNPAYVAVNGTVYDVTNNAAWAAGTHFGLTAGKDLSSAFASCHSGQTVLSKLTVVGKLI